MTEAGNQVSFNKRRSTGRQASDAEKTRWGLRTVLAVIFFDGRVAHEAYEHCESTLQLQLFGANFCTIHGRSFRAQFPDHVSMISNMVPDRA